MSRVSRQQAAENRARVVAAASAQFRCKGIDGIGIRDLMAEAGLTQGGFAGQFGSKDVLAAEACEHAFRQAGQAMEEVAEGETEGRLRRLVEFYFAPKPPEFACPMATLAGDVARAPVGGPVRQAFTAGLQRLVSLVTRAENQDRTLAIFAAMVGAAVLRRASDDASLAEAIERSVFGLVKSRDMHGV